EPAAMVLIDAVVRLLPGALGDEASARHDSFASGLLEGPHYTRPREFRGMAVPEVLLSGNHAEIEAWRRAQSIERTRQRRPDLLEHSRRTDLE
ncbi:MAG: tRNA (guanosine(37)-N1)-methyltransferase TrmD, partial [Planctomycetes bacterium]|nr:tRNA (guanosine(37)-N1)-methyltransferase TrmD [Planctomycetota bacterium]